MPSKLRMWWSWLFPIKGYKVTAYSLHKKGRVSTWAQGSAQVVYKKGKKVRAPRSLARLGYHLCAFLDQEQAEEFAGKRECVLEAKLYGVHIPKVPMCTGWTFIAGALTPSKRPWPLGTVMAKRIEVIEEVGRH